MLPVYSETRVNRFLEMGWELMAVNRAETNGIPEFILGWCGSLPAPSPEGGVFDMEDGQWKFKSTDKISA